MGMDEERVWAEINLDDLAHNFRETKRLLQPGTRVMGIVKADAYGHGAVVISQVLIENGVDRLGVACLEEAVELRKGGIGVPIQVLSRTLSRNAEDILHYDIIQTLSDMELATELSRSALRQGKKAKVHIELDTGMGRLGWRCDSTTVSDIVNVCKMPGLDVEGAMTHFSASDEADADYTKRQFNMFTDMCRMFEKQGVFFRILHAANSAAIIKYPEMNLNMVRPGIMLYGLHPAAQTGGATVHLRPVMTLKTKILGMKWMDAGEYVSYGRTYKTASKCLVGVLPLGYADGFARLLSNKAQVSIHGVAAPVVGKICMDHSMIDLTSIPGPLSIGSEVIVFGGKECSITADDVATQSGTISYEVVCKVGRRIPRYYYKNGKICCINRYI